VNLLEQAIAALAPGVAARRAASRLRLQLINERGFEGAARGRRTDNWKTGSRDANGEIIPALRLLRNRARDLRRNNPYASAAIESIIDNTVGYGIKPKPKGRNKTITRRAAEAWKEHCETRAIDYDGVHDIYGLEALALGAIVESGEVLVRRRWRNSAAKLPLPFQLQVLESDFLDDTKDGVFDGKVVIGGVQLLQSGAVEGYWLYREHPGARTGLRHMNSEFVPAADVLHVYRMDRPGQVRGVPWAAPVMLRLRNFDEVEDAYIEREKVASCFSVFFTAPDAEAAAKKVEIAERLEPGLIDFAPPGTDVSFASPPGVNGYRDFAWINLHAIAAGYGVPYEVFSDLAGVNFSSGRMGWQNYQRRIDRWQWQMFIPGFCAGVWRWFNDAAKVAGVLAEDCPAEWVPPRRMMVNPKEEIAAMKEEVRNGFATWPQQITALGYDPVEQAEAIAEANELLDANGLKLDCDPRFALPAGSAGATKPAAANDNEPEEPAKTDDDNPVDEGESEEEQAK